MSDCPRTEASIPWSDRLQDAKWRTLESNVFALDSHVELLVANDESSVLPRAPMLGYSIAVRMAATEAYFATVGRLMDRDPQTASLWCAMKQSAQSPPNKWARLQTAWYGDDATGGQIQYRHNVVAHANATLSASARMNELPRLSLADLVQTVDDVWFCFAWIVREKTGHAWHGARHDGDLKHQWTSR
jgi:hypothetical protein